MVSLTACSNCYDPQVRVKGVDNKGEERANLPPPLFSRDMYVWGKRELEEKEEDGRERFLREKLWKGGGARSGRGIQKF